MWVLFAFCAAFFAGITAILAKIGIENTDANLATAIRTVVIVVFAWLVVLTEHTMSPIDFSTINGENSLFLVLSGITTGASWIYYFKALQMGNVNVVVPIDKSSTILTMLFAISFLSEPFTWLTGLCILLIGLGTYMMLPAKKQSAVQKGSDRKWLLYAVLAAVFAAATAILAKVGMTGINSNFGTAVRTVIVLIMAWGIVFWTNKQAEIKLISKKSWLFLILSGLATGLSWLFYFRALQTGKASVVVPIDKLSIIITIMFAYFVLKERLSTKSFAGLISLVAGTLLLLAV